MSVRSRTGRNNRYGASAMDDGTYEAVKVRRHQGVGWITLNRPDAINAINNHMRRELPDALRALDADPEVAVICIHGSGDRGFCAGADLKEKAPPPAEAPSKPSASWIQSFDEISKPLVAAIHGYCLGGGFEIALACDIRVAAQNAVFGLPETRIGLIPGGGGTQRLARLTGLGPALDMILTGERADADRAYHLGIVTRVLPSDSHLEDATRFVNELASRSAVALQLAKHAAKKGCDMSLDDGLRLEHKLFAQLIAEGKKNEAATAFANKT